MNTSKQIILIVVLVFALVGGCAAYAAYDLPTRFEIQEEYQYEGRVERGALLYANNCRTCHGIKGEGFVGPVLNTPEFKDQSPLVLAQNQALLRRTLECGRAGTLMPAWLKENGGALSRIQIEHLVEFITQEATELDENGEPTSKGWLHAVEFGHNLNHDSPALVGGDTLGNIARAHNIGPAELLAANAGNLKFQEGQAESVTSLLERGSKVRLLPIDGDADGHVYQIRQDNETLAKIAESQSVGAMILADLNGIPYKFDYKSARLTLFQDPEKTVEVPGLLPGETLELPDGATYTVIAEDTIANIAEHHGISADELVDLNEDILGDLEEDEVIPHQPTLTLPNGTGVRVLEGDTIGTIAAAHGLAPADVAALNDRTEDAVLNPGETINLPDETGYIIQPGDTLASVAEHHAISVADLTNASGVTLEPEFPLPTTITLELPKVTELVINGDSIEDVAAGYGGIIALDLAEENGLSVDERLYVGTTLALPPDTYGTSPPDAINPGTACVQHAVTGSTLEMILGTNFDPETGPEEVSEDVVVEAHSNDWTIVADGNAQEPNRGLITVAQGTTVVFTSVTGLHNIVWNGEPQGPDINTGDTRELTFEDPGKYQITCDYHPDMLAYIFVE